MLFFFVHWVFMGIIEQNLETNTLLTHNNALEKKSEYREAFGSMEL